MMPTTSSKRSQRLSNRLILNSRILRTISTWMPRAPKEPFQKETNGFRRARTFSVRLTTWSTPTIALSLQRTGHSRSPTFPRRPRCLSGLALASERKTLSASRRPLRYVTFIFQAWFKLNRLIFPFLETSLHEWSWGASLRWQDLWHSGWLLGCQWPSFIEWRGLKGPSLRTERKGCQWTCLLGHRQFAEWLDLTAGLQTFRHQFCAQDQAHLHRRP